MKKRRGISLLLALLTLLEVMVTTVYAKASETPKMPYYVAIGDSIASGYGLRGNAPERLFADFHFLTDVVHNSAASSYPRLVANGIARAVTGAKKAQDSEFANLGAPGYALTDYHYIFQETNPEKLQAYVNPFWEKNIQTLTTVITPGKELDWSEFQWANTLVEETKKADLITFHLGANDTMQPLWTLMNNHENPLIKLFGYLLKIAVLDIDTTKLDMGSVMEALSGNTGGALDLREILGSINEKMLRECLTFLDQDNLTQILMDSANEIKELYGETLDQVQKLNPTAKIVVVGPYNPYGNSDKYHGVNYTPARIISQLYVELKFGLPIISRQLLEGIKYSVLHGTLGEMAQAPLDYLNEIAKAAAEERGLPFVNTMDKVRNEARIAIHPTAKQQEEIANAILDVLMPRIRYGSDTWKVDPFGADAPTQVPYGTEITLTVPAGAVYVTVNHKRVWDNTMKTRNVHFTATEPDTIVYAHYSQDEVCPQLIRWKTAKQTVQKAIWNHVDRICSLSLG